MDRLVGFGTCALKAVAPAAADPAGLCYTSSGVDTVEVSSASALASAVSAAPPGRNILVAPGTYAASTITLDGTGTEANPIIIRPRDGIGTVTWNTANWTWATGSSRIVLDSMYFNGGRRTFQGSFNRITRCRFRQIDNRAIFCVVFDNCRIDHCDFSGFVGTGNRGAVHVDTATVTNGTGHDLLVDYCYFHDFTSSSGVSNVVLFPLSSSTDSPSVNSGLILDHCLFQTIDRSNSGEDVAIKCGGVTVRFCTFLDCPSPHYLQTRVATNCEFRSNWYENCAVGFKFWGSGHLAIGNYIDTDLWVGAGTANYPVVGGTAAYFASHNGRFIGNIVDGSLIVGAMWSDQTRVDQAENNTIEAHTGTIDTATNSAWHTGTVINATTVESYVPAVKLTTADVGLAAPDPLCGGA